MSSIGKLGIELLISFLAGRLIVLLAGRHPPMRVMGVCREFSGMLRSKVGQSGWYARRMRKMVSCGVPFHMGKRTEPVLFLATQLVLGVLGFWGVTIFLGEDALLASCVFAVLLFFLPELLMVYLNRRDNEEMLPELRTIYLALSMQIRAGVYVTDALAECYGSVTMPRLRQALLDLAGDIVMKADLFEALDRFQRKFENRYIDSLCITLLQAMESGQAIELLGDISDQVRDMESSVLAKRKGRLDRSLTFYQLGMLCAVMLVALYACVSYMLNSAIFS